MHKWLGVFRNFKQSPTNHTNGLLMNTADALNNKINLILSYLSSVFVIFATLYKLSPYSLIMILIFFYSLCLFRTPEQCPSVVSLLSESYNPHVRCGAAMALGICCAGTGLKVSFPWIPLLIWKLSLLLLVSCCGSSQGRRHSHWSLIAIVFKL